MNILINWNTDLELGIKEIDQHHKKLVDLINLTYDSLINNVPESSFHTIINELTDYAFIHFKFEEKLFHRFEFEETENHLREHTFFIDKVKKLRLDWEHDDSEKKQELVEFLKKWLEHHIKNTDKKYVACFKKNGM